MREIKLENYLNQFSQNERLMVVVGELRKKEKLREKDKEGFIKEKEGKEREGREREYWWWKEKVEKEGMENVNEGRESREGECWLSKEKVYRRKDKVREGRWWKEAKEDGGKKRRRMLIKGGECW